MLMIQEEKVVDRSTTYITALHRLWRVSAHLSSLYTVAYLHPTQSISKIGIPVLSYCTVRIMFYSRSSIGAF